MKPVSYDTGIFFMGLVAICVSSSVEHMFKSLAPFVKTILTICLHIDDFFSSLGMEPRVSHTLHASTLPLRSIPGPFFSLSFLKHLK